MGSLAGGPFKFRYFFFGRLGRCVKADPAADLAALLLLGLRSTFDAADAARLLVTSLFALRFTISTLLSLIANSCLQQIYWTDISYDNKGYHN